MASIDAEQFSLRWNNFHNNLTAGFHDLLLGEDLVDVTLAAEGKFLQAHKMVLSVCSPYFKDLFKVNPCKHPIVILKDTGYKELEALLQFMYRGEVNVRQEELAMFLKTAEMLQIKGLTGNDSPKESSEVTPRAPKTSSTRPAPARTHHLPQDTSTHPPPKRKRSEAPVLPSTSSPAVSVQAVDIAPQTPPEGTNAEVSPPDGNDILQMMNPKMEPQEYDESEDGLEFSADDTMGQDHLVQQLLSGGTDGQAHSKGNMSGLGSFVGLPEVKDGNTGQDGGQVNFKECRTIGGHVCPICDRRFTRRDNLKIHFSNLHGEHRGPFRCGFCFKVTKNKMSLRAHMKNYHPYNLQRKSTKSGSNNPDSPGPAGEPQVTQNATSLFSNVSTI